MLLIKCPKEIQATQVTKKKVQNPDFLLFFFCFSRIVWASLKLLESVTEPPQVSSFSPLLLCVCQWADLPVCPLSLPLRVWVLERWVASPLFSRVWLPLLFWPQPFFFFLPLPLCCLYHRSSAWLSGVSARWLNLVFSFHLIYPLQQLPRCLRLIGRLLKPLGFEELSAFMWACTCKCVCPCVCVCVRVGDRGWGVCPTPLFVFPPSPPFLCLHPFPD